MRGQSSLLGRDIKEDKLVEVYTEAWNRQKKSRRSAFSRDWWVGRKRLSRADYEVIIDLLVTNGVIQGRIHGSPGQLLLSPEEMIARMNSNKTEIICLGCKESSLVYLDGEDSPYCSTCRCGYDRKQTRATARECNRVLNCLIRSSMFGRSATLTLEQWLKTLDHYNNLCAYCRKRPYKAMDHFIPVIMGGGTTADNVVPICISCNSIKGYKSPDNEFMLRALIGTNLDIEGVRVYLHGLRSASIAGS